MSETSRPFHSFVAAVVLFFSVCARLSAAPTFSHEAGTKISTAAPQAIIGTASGFRMYFLRDFQIYSATSTDGVAWGEEAGLRLSSATVPSVSISSVTGFALLSLSAGGYRAVYSAITSTAGMRIFSATSSDGLGWANDADTRIAPSSTFTFVGSPRLIKLSNGDWRLYYVQNIATGSAAASQRVFTSLSTDEGLAWSAGTLLLSNQVSEIAVSTLTSARVRLFYTAPLSTETANTQLRSALSSDTNGTSFSAETGVRFATGAAAGEFSSVVVTRSTDSYRWRAYFGFVATGSTFSHTFSALTVSPDLRSISPNSVNRSDSAATYTIAGEIFSENPAIKLTQSGQSDIVGTSVTRDDDQTITAVFDTNGKALGTWSVVVTNSDGNTDSLGNAFTITFSGGFVTLTDNLMRPLTGARTRIDATIFDDGDVHIRIFSLQGRLLKTLVDGRQSAGTLTFYWDGKTDDGNTVASGTYMALIEGPKLNVTTKIVVIK